MTDLNLATETGSVVSSSSDGRTRLNLRALLQEMIDKEASPTCTLPRGSGRSSGWTATSATRRWTTF